MINPKPHPYRYLPFLSGRYSTGAGLRKLSKAENERERLVFLIDHNYGSYLENKRQCKIENPQKYFCQCDFRDETRMAVNRYLVAQLTKEYPSFFNTEIDHRGQIFRNLITNEQFVFDKSWDLLDNDSFGGLFDILCMQVQEDIAVWQFDAERDWLAAVHLSAPNYWSAEEKVGKDFSSVHDPVPEMDKLKRHYRPMLEAVIEKNETFTRYGWGITTDDRLNHHPAAPESVDLCNWHGRDFSDEPENCFIRAERQNLIGIRSVHALIFTIRTYFYALSDLSGEEKSALREALQSMSEKTLKYKELSGKLYSLLPKLS